MKFKIAANFVRRTAGASRSQRTNWLFVTFGTCPNWLLCRIGVVGIGWGSWMACYGGFLKLHCGAAVSVFSDFETGEGAEYLQKEFACAVPCAQLCAESLLK